MAIRLLAYEVADLCLGKPPLRPLSSSATVAEAIAALKSTEDNSISVWNCDHRNPLLSKRNLEECFCVGKLSMVDITCYLCREENLASPGSALRSPVSVLLSKVKGLVRHVEPSSSLLEAIDLMLQGTQNLVVPIKSYSKRKQLQDSASPTNHHGQEFCWLTQEDVIRFLLNLIGLFTPIPSLSINSLNIISQDFLSINYHSRASLAIGPIYQSLIDQTSVAITDEEGTLIGEISPVILACCDETAAAAIATLSAGDLMAYIDCAGPPEELVRIVRSRLKERNIEGVLEALVTNPENGNLSSSSDDELPSPRTVLSGSVRHSRSSSFSSRMMRRAETIICNPGSSLVAVMIQAITHRMNYVWVVEDDCSVAGIVTFANMLQVFRENLGSVI